MFVHGADTPGLRTTAGRPRAKAILVTLLMVAACIPLLACHKAGVYRIPVSDADILRANEISQEGESAFRRKEYYAALIKYLESVRINPNNEYVYNRLGMAYSQLRLFDDAVAAFERAIALNQKYPYPYNNLGAVFFARRDLKKAEKHFKKAVKLREDEATFHMNLGSVYLERKKPEKAIAEWRKALALDPASLSGDASAVMLSGGGRSMRERSYYVARVRASLGDAAGAVESLKEAVSLGFDDIAQIKRERDFDAIRHDERFARFMEELPLLIRLRSGVGLPEGSK
ncbi:MAG: tetratricopeptide repeat protein [Acidobacteria bacterium]|nr:tetratricopeptide repeat protein [Acidobacteriota bacterium]